MSVVVKKSAPVVVRPSERATASSGTIRLSSFDKVVEDLPTTVLLVFEHPIHEASETIKRALSQALVHYYPFAGRSAAGGADGESYIQCNGEGASFVAASASCALKEAMPLSDQLSPGTSSWKLLGELAVHYPAGCCGPDDPLLLVQVTEFSCGGFVLGVTWNHAVADGAGMGQFLQAVGELARGSAAPSVAPVRWDGSLPGLPPAVSPSFKELTASFDMFDDLAALDFAVPSSSIDKIKADFGGRFGGETCTAFEAATAVIWRCRTRAIMAGPEAPALLLFAANVRRHVGAKEGYYGNCMTTNQVVAESGAVAGGDILDVVKMIRDAKEKIPDRFRNSISSPQPQAMRQLLQQLAHLQVRYNMLLVSSWRNIGLDEADFGNGKPARVATCRADDEKLPIPFSVLLPHNKGKDDDGANASSVMVKREHARAFLGELASFA